MHEKDSATVIEALHDGSVDVGLITRNPFISSSEDPLNGLKIHGEILDTLEIIASPDNPLVKCLFTIRETRKDVVTNPYQ